MKKFKQILTFVLLLSMVLSMLPSVSLRAKAADTTWKLVTDISEVVFDGTTEYLFVGSKNGSYYVAGADSSNKFTCTDITSSVSGDTITLADTVTADTFTFGGSASAATVYSNLKSQYVGYNSKTNLKFGTDGTAAGFSWSVAVSSDGVATIASTATPSRYFGLNAETGYIGPYADTASYPYISLYVKSTSSGTDPNPGTDTYTFTRVTSVTSGKKYLIVSEGYNVAFNGSLTTSSDLSAANNVVTVSPADGKITGGATLLDSTVTITASGSFYTVQTSSGYYIGRTATSAGLNANTATAYENEITFVGNNAVIKSVINSVTSSMKLQFNNSANVFRYYSTTQKDIQLYELVTSTEPEPTEPTEPSTEPTQPSTEPGTDSYTFTRVASVTSGKQYLIVSEGSNAAFNGSLASATEFGASNNKITVEPVDGKITGAYLDSTFTITASGSYYTIQSASGFYIGRTAASSGLNTNKTTAYENEITFSGANAVIKPVISSAVSDIPLQYNKATNGNKFSYYTSTQQAIQLYELNASTEPADPTEPSDLVELPADCVASNVKIITGEGTVYVLDSDGNRLPTYTKSGTKYKPTGTDESSVPPNDVLDPYYVFTKKNQTYTIVIAPAVGQRLSCFEVGGTTVSDYSWSDALNAYTHTATINTYAVVFRVSFLPNRGDAGITAILAEELVDGEYIITAPDKLTNYAYGNDQTYFLYGTKDTVLVDGDDCVLGRKSAAILMSDVGVTIENVTTYTLSGLNEGAVFTIKESETNPGYYTVKAYEPMSDNYVCVVAKDGFATEKKLSTTSDPAADAALWKLDFDATTHLTKFTNKLTTSAGSPIYLKFNAMDGSKLFRAYTTDGDNNYPDMILYKADFSSFGVTYSAATVGGSVTGLNGATAFASGENLPKGSTVTFKAEALEGYEVDYATLNGEVVELNSDGTYVYTPLDHKLNFVVYFKEEQKDNTITVRYWLNDETTAFDTRKPVCGGSYYIDLSGEVNIEAAGKSFPISELQFNGAKKNGAEIPGITADSAISVTNGDVIDLYFLTVAVKLDKTATETTKTTGTTAGNGGNTVTGNFAGSGENGGNQADAHGNIKQTFTVNLNVAAGEMIPGYDIPQETDIVLILDNSNSMYPQYSNNIAYLKNALSVFLDTALPSGTGNRVSIACYGSKGHVFFIEGDSIYYTPSNSLLNDLAPQKSYDQYFINDRSTVDTIINYLYDTEADLVGKDGGATNMYMGFKAAEYILDARYRAISDTERNLMVVMFTDGIPTYSYGKDDDNGTDADGHGWEPCPGVHNTTMSEVGNLRSAVNRFEKARKNKIVSVALIPDSKPGAIAEAERILGTTGQAKRWKYNNNNTHKYESGKYVPLYALSSDAYEDSSNTTYWEDTTALSDNYEAVTEGNEEEVASSLNKIFEQFSKLTIDPKYITGTVTDIIPKDFAVDTAKLDASGLDYTLTPNADGTTTITFNEVYATKDGTNISYDLIYTGTGGGAYYTNQSASYTFADFKQGDKEVTINFPMPLAQIIPFTVNDISYTIAGVENIVHVKANDLFNQLQDAGHQIIGTTFTLTDKDGNPVEYKINTSTNEGMDAKFTDPAKGTLQTFSFENGNHILYYTVTMTVKDPSGKVYTVTSRATEVDIYVASIYTLPDISITVVGENNTIDVMANDPFTDLENQGYSFTSTTFALTDSEGEPLDYAIDSSDNSGINATFPNTSNGTLETYSLQPGVQTLYYTVTVAGTNPNGEAYTATSNATKVIVVSAAEPYIVLDFGAQTENFDVFSFNGDVTVSGETKLANLVTLEAANADTVNLFAVWSKDGNALKASFTPKTTNFSSVEDVPYTIKLAESVYSTAKTITANVKVMPANNVLYEETAITFTSTGWEDEAGGTSHKQEVNNTSEDAAHLHGFDQNYADSTNVYSNGSAKVATVSTTNRTKTANFTFTGTGFDLISQVSKDSGVIIAKVYNSKNVKVATYVADNYFQSASYYQIPAIAYRTDTYGTYTVELTAYYHAAFDHCGIADKAEAARILGMKEEDFILVQASDLIQGANPKATRAPEAKAGQYNVYIDAVRIYQPLGANPTDPVARKAYQDDGETNSVFQNVSKILKSADSWNGGVYGGAIFLGGNSENAGIDDEYGSGGFYLNTGGTMKYEEVGGKKYLLDPTKVNDQGKNERIKFKGFDVYFKDRDVDEVDESVTTKYSFYYYDTEKSKEVKLIPSQVSSLGIILYADKYEAVGPENEVYLSAGQGIGFNTNGSNLQITVKSPDGKTNTLEAYKDGTWHPVAKNVKSRTEMYYSLNNYVGNDGLVVIRCAEGSESFLSVCNVKGVVTGEGSQSLVSIDPETVYNAVMAFRGGLELPPDPLEPQPTEPTEPSTDPTDPTEPTTEPVEPTTEPVEPTTEPVEPTTEPVEPTTETTEPTTEPQPEQPCDGGKDCPAGKFDDLDNTLWYHQGVDFALNQGLMNGVGDGKFDPDGALTRAMLVTILYRREGEPSVEALENPFTDVPEGLWYTDAVIWAASEGIVRGVTETGFEPDANITREQIAVILYRYDGEKKSDGTLDAFADQATVSAYAVEALKWAVAEGIINGMDGNLEPLSDATRAQVAKILYCYWN